MRVLLVENDPLAAKQLQGALTRVGFVIELADTGEEALELARHYEFDLVALKLSLPDLDGSKVISRMRTARLNTPVLAFSNGRDPGARVRAFSAGADDVVDHNLDRDELVARMRAIVRRTHGHTQAALQIGPLTLDTEQHEVSANGKPIPLTGKEFAILHLLMLRKNMILTKETILSQIYGGLDEPEVKIIDVFVCKIRKKLTQAGVADMIATVWGRGYSVRDSRDQLGPSSAPPQVSHPVQHVRNLAFA